MTRVKVKLVPIIKEGVSFNSVSDKVGVYFNDKIKIFKKMMLFYLDEFIETFEDANYFIDDKINGILDKAIDHIEEERYKNKIKKDEEEKKKHIEKIMSLMADDNEISEQITEMKEFKKELLMENFLDEETNVGKRR